MNKAFVELAEKIIDERGKNILLDNKLAKAFFQDYGKGEFKKEINLLIKTIELNYAKKIIDSNDLEITGKILSRELTEEHFINGDIANSIVMMLMGLLRNKYYLKKIDEKINNTSFEIEIKKKKQIENILIILKKLMLKKLDINIVIVK